MAELIAHDYVEVCSIVILFPCSGHSKPAGDSINMAREGGRHDQEWQLSLVKIRESNRLCLASLIWDQGLSLDFLICTRIEATIFIRTAGDVREK